MVGRIYVRLFGERGLEIFMVFVVVGVGGVDVVFVAVGVVGIFVYICG